MNVAPQSSARVHITGGRGRLATMLAANLRTRGFKVELYSRTAADGFKDLRVLLAGGAVAPEDAVLHLAWSTLPATSEQHSGRELTEDLPLLEQLLEGISRTESGAKPHFVFFSSGGAVYGNAGVLPSREIDVCRPIGSYGRAKLAAEGTINRFQAAGSLSCAVLRVSNPYGYQTSTVRPQGVINRAIAFALSGEEFVVWGDGSARKDFIYQDDFLAALERVLRLRLAGTYNLCGGESYSVDDVIRAVESHTGRRISRLHVPAPIWDVQNSRLDGSLLRRMTSWCPVVTLNEGIGRSVERFIAGIEPLEN